MKNDKEPQKEKIRYFAITYLGKDRWYWVVWPSLDEIRTSDEPLLQVGEGYEKTKTDAAERALGLAGKYAEWIAAKYARIYHHNKTGVKHRGPNPHMAERPDAPKMNEFLYRDVYDAKRRQWVPVPHRVVKRTRKFVYVEQNPYSPAELTGSWLDAKHQTFRLDRWMVEHEGYAFVPATAYIEDAEEFYFTDERTKAPEKPQIKCIQVLNLSWPCTEEDVKEAYRKLVKSAHPDGGGNHEKFLALQEAYEQALVLCRIHSEKTNSSKKHTVNRR